MPYTTEEGGRLNDQTLVEPHEPGVSVLVGLPVMPDTFPVPDDDRGVAVSVDSAHGYRTEPLREPGTERSEYLSNELFLAIEGL